MKQRVTEMVKEVSLIVNKVPEITHLGNPILRKKCASVIYEDGLATAKKLIAVLDKYRKLTGVGAGLAAPQIGIAQQVFVTYDGKSKQYQAFINPLIRLSSHDKNYYRESCLSSRMMWADIQRPATMTMSYININGENKEEQFGGFAARLLQHEYDHLQGIPCLDRALVGSIEYSGEVKEEKLREKPIVSG